MENFEQWPILGGISSPEDLKALPADQLGTLAAEIREYLAYRVTENGGHLASNLGIVEMTMAIHRVFESPHDHVIFDVGHQSYVHKLLTGRKEQFDTLRCPGGLSGFTKRAESEHDAFGAGHSSTAISAAIGMAEAEYQKGSHAWTVAVVGDGALTGGLSYEGLNNCAHHLRLLIIINENEMSISPNTGRLAQHLSKMRASRRYLRTKRFTARFFLRVPLIGRPIFKFLRWCKRRIKHMFYRENLFEHMGIRYMGPINGNDVMGVEEYLHHAKKLDHSVILHLKTTKGQGYAPAEENPNAYHGIAPKGKAKQAITFSRVMGEELTRMAGEDTTVCAITAAMSCGTGLEPFRRAIPSRFYDVGIAEGHAVTFGAGLAAGGMRPVIAVYSTFLQRAYDNILHDAALQNLPICLCIDRAGLNAGDGPTHHGIFDVAMLSQIPGAAIYAPVTMEGLRRSLRKALQSNCLTAIRYPNGGEDESIVQAFYADQGAEREIGVRRFGDAPETAKVTIVTHGRIAAIAVEAVKTLRAEGILANVTLCEYLAPYAALAAEVAPTLGARVLFLEEELRTGGFGMSLSDALRQIGALDMPFRVMGTEDGFLTLGAGQTALQAAGLDLAAVLRAAKELIKEEN